MRRLVLMAPLALSLGACAHGGPASIAGGECRIFERPQYEVRGRRAYDQDWIDSQIEGGVGGCHWKRPAPRPASLDAAPGAKPKPVAPAKHRSLVRRIRDRVLPQRPENPAPPPPPAIEPVPAVVAPAPPPPPRSAVDRLLQPRDDD